MNYIPENVIEPIKNKIRILEIGCINAKIAKQIALLSCEPSKEKREYIAACFSKKFAAKSSKYIHKKVYLGKRITRNTGYSLWPEGDTPDQIILNGDGFKSAADVKKALIFLSESFLSKIPILVIFPHGYSPIAIENVLCGRTSIINSRREIFGKKCEFVSGQSLAKLLLNNGWLIRKWGYFNAFKKSRGRQRSQRLQGFCEEHHFSPSLSELFSTSHTYLFAVQSELCNTNANQKTKTNIIVIVPVNHQWQYESTLLESPGLKEIDAEIIVVRNSISAADAFSKGSQKASSSWLLFVHQDVYFPCGSGFSLIKQIKELSQQHGKNIPIGFVGAYLDQQGVKRMAGAVLDRSDWIYSKVDTPEVDFHLDELGIILHKNSQLSIDQNLGWHLWATDLCLQAEMMNNKPSAQLIYIPVFHDSSLRPGWDRTSWNHSARALQKKWPHQNFIHSPCGIITRNGNQLSIVNSVHV